VLQNLISSYFPPGSVLKPGDYSLSGTNPNDTTPWPSLQQLQRDGKRIMFTTNDSILANYDGPIFSKSAVYPAQYGGGAFSPGNVPARSSLPGYNPSRFTRAFPGTSACGVADVAGLAYVAGYNFPSDNCLGTASQVSLSAPLFHPPTPMNVNDSGVTPPDWYSEYGTWISPYIGADGLAKALHRINGHFEQTGVKSLIEVRIEQGTYTAPAALGSMTGSIEGAVVLRARSGTVVIN
jgi:hypothetical protein